MTVGSFQNIVRNGVKWCVSLRADGSLVFIERDGRLMWTPKNGKAMGAVLKDVAFQAQVKHAMQAEAESCAS